MLLSSDVVFPGDIPPGWELKWVNDAILSLSNFCYLQTLNLFYHILNHGLYFFNKVLLWEDLI
jgi:hypothetical protein